MKFKENSTRNWQEKSQGINSSRGHFTEKDPKFKISHLTAPKQEIPNFNSIFGKT